MQSLSWAPEHSAALREFVERGMSYADAADAVNARFGTAYSRSAAIGRAKRMGLVVGGRPEDRLAMIPRMQKGPDARGNGTRKRSDHHGGVAGSPPASAERAEPAKLRCVGLQPRLLSLAELEDGDCRYPYGGTRTVTPSRFASIPASAARLTAVRIFIWRALPPSMSSARPDLSCCGWWTPPDVGRNDNRFHDIKENRWFVSRADGRFVRLPFMIGVHAICR